MAKPGDGRLLQGRHFLSQEGSLVSLATRNRLARVLDVAPWTGAAARVGQAISCRLPLFRSGS